MNFGSPWTPEKFEELKALVDEELSSGEIAKRLHLTRNAVMGKLERSGIKLFNAGRTVGNTKPRRPEGVANNDRKVTQTTKRAGAATALDGPELIDLPPEVIPVEQRKTLYELTDDTCRWPIGNPTDADFHFCGAGPEANRPYCPAHSRIAYETSTERRKRVADWRFAQAEKARAA